MTNHDTEYDNHRTPVVRTTNVLVPHGGGQRRPQSAVPSMKPTPEEKLDIAEALVATNGNYAMAGKRLNKSRTWITSRVEYDTQLLELVEEVQQSIVDNVFSAMQIKAMAGDYACMNRILNTLGKHRGLHEKQEIVIERVDESPQTLELRLSEKLGGLTPDQIRMLAGLD